MDECCGKYLNYTSSQELCKKDSNYNLGFICDNCSHAFGKQAHFYHCSLCKNDLCEECYEDQQMDTEGEEEESGEEQEDDGFILIGEYAQKYFKWRFQRNQLEQIGKIAKTMFYYKYGTVPVFNEEISYEANRYDIKDEDIVKRAIQFYVNK